MRAALYVVGLAFGRVRRRSSGALLAAVGIAIGTAVLVGVLAGTKIAQDRSVSQAVDRIPAASRSVRAVWFGVPVGAAQEYPAIDAAVRSKLENIGLPGPTPIVLFRESTVAGHFVSIAGVKGLAPYVHVTSGRLPRTCTPARCEVLLLRGTGRLPNAPGLRLVKVGTGTLRSSQLFGDFLAPTDNALEDRELAPALQQAAIYHRPQPAPLVVAEGIEALTRAPATANTYRSYAWMWPLAAGRPRQWEIDGLVSRSEQSRAALSGDSIGYSVQAPVEELRAMEQSATVAGRRLLLVGGEAAALLFAFAVLAARSMRRDLEAARRRLTWYGARRWQLRLLTVTESAVVAVAGAVTGWLTGVAAGTLAASRAGAPVGAVLRESVLSAEGLAIAAGVVVLATLVVAVATSMPARDESRFGPLDVAAAGSVALVAAALLGGAADQSRLAESQNAGLVLLLLPGLIAFAAAVAAARLFGPLVRLAGRVLHRSVGARLAAVTLGRGPGAAAVTVAFLTLAFALALLAEGYRATLVQAETDQASFAVPLDILVREDLKSLIPVLDAAPLSRYATLAGGSKAVPVVRIRGSVGNAEGISGITVLGIPATETTRLHGWRSDFSGDSRAALAAAVTPPADASVKGIPLGSRLRLDAGPGLVSLRATIATPDGRYSFLKLGSLAAHAPTHFDRLLPARLRGGKLVALELLPPRLIDRGADAGEPLAGSLRLRGLAAEDWLGEGGIVLRPARDGVELTFRINLQNDSRIRARQATDSTPPAVLVTPRVAALVGGVGGTLALEIGARRVPVRVAAIVDHFPGTSGQAVIGDLTSLATAVNAQVPGAGEINEVWLDTPSGGTEAAMAALAQPPFRGVESRSRAELLDEARDDPLGHGTLLALASAAVVALLLAALGLALTVLSDLRDDRGDLYDLESQGAEPRLLRRIVRVRALVVGIAGVLAGAAAGALLALLVTRVVSVTARATTSDLPLQTSFDLRVLVVAAVAYLLLAAALVALATRRAFRDDRGPERAQEAGDMSLIEARDLFCVYPGADGGIAALQGLTLDVEEGEICVILGPSGSGKTTLMRVLAGFDRPSAGSIAVAGLQLGTLSQRRLADYRATTLGYADQHYWRALAGELTAEALVAVPLGLHGIPEQERLARAHELLERVGLRDRADAHPGELSGGEQQRIALCAALAHRPRLLIADEPTGELDELSAAAVYSLLAELSREERVTALVVSHDPRSAAIADRVIHIRDGRVSEERSGESAAVVIGRGGWMRIPEEALREAGIVERATVSTHDGVVELRPVGASQAEALMLPDIEGAAGALVELRGVTRRYGQDVALDDLTATFAPGRLSVVTGPSGSGKSTLLSLVSGLDLPDEGEVLIGGRSMSELDRDARARFRRDTVAFIGQSPGLSGFLTARENVELGLAIRGIEGIDAHERAIDALVAVGLAEHADRLADLLSAGQRERVAVARALAARTPVILADEPTSRVDVTAALTLGGLFADIAHEHGTTFICATHDPVLIGFADVDVQLRRAGAPVPST